jgi:C4-dicarboxylate transporter DctM subunit
MLTPIILIGGIASGFFTPTEASAVAVLYAFILLLVQKKATFSDIKKIFLDTASSVGAILIIIATASIVSYILTLDKIPIIFTQFMLSLTNNKYIILLLINFLLLIVGCFFESIVAIMLVFPILRPIILSLQVDLLHFGVIMIANLALGMLTPPVGCVLYASSTVGKIKIHNLVRQLTPFYLVMSVTLIILTFVPQISLFLPNIIWH